MSSPEESRLRQHFENLRAADRPATPPFPGTLAAAERRRPARKAPRTWAITAVILTMCAGTFTILRMRTTPPTPLAEAGAIAAWSSPTAFLLETPGKRLLVQTPRFGVPALVAWPAEKEQSK